MIEWLSMPWKNYNAAALAKLLARSSVPITQERGIFNWHGSLSVSILFNLNCLVGNSISFDMSLSDLPRMEMPKLKSRAASRWNEFTRLMELHDAEFSPCPLLLMNESDRLIRKSKRIIGLIFHYVIKPMCLIIRRRVTHDTLYGGLRSGSQNSRGMK